MLPKLSQADADGCLWICIHPDCPELCAGELETEDLAGGGVSTSWGTGSDVEDQALAARLVRLIDYYEDTIEELHAQGAPAPPPAGSRERAQADLASLCRQVRELRRRSALAAAAADQLGLERLHSRRVGARTSAPPTPPRGPHGRAPCRHLRLVRRADGPQREHAGRRRLRLDLPEPRLLAP
jgi:hypothetical protein